MRLCDEAGYQPDVQTCDELSICRIPSVCEVPTKRPDTDGWKVVFELEDDNNVDDVPDDPNVVLVGFKTKNSYFVGAQKLKTMTYTKAQLCAGYRSNTDGCPRVKCYELQDSWTAATPFGILPTWPANINDVGFPKDMSKAITCFAGGGDPDCPNFVKTGQTNSWRFPIGYADDPAPMDTYGNAETGNLKYHCGGGQVHGLNSFPNGRGWLFSGSGLLANYPKDGKYGGRQKNHNELHLYAETKDRCGNKAHMPPAVATDTMDYMNLLQIRVK